MARWLCPGCGLARSLWAGKDGEGVERGGRVFCCDGCARARGCCC